MTRILSPRGRGLPPGTGVPLTLLIGIWAAVAAFGLFWLAAGAAAWLTGHRWHQPPVTVATARQLVTAGTATLWPGVPVALIVGLVVVALLLLTTPPAWIWALRTRRSCSTGPLRRSVPGLTSLAHAGDVEALTPAGVTRRARALRPSLAGVPARDLSAADTGLALGSLLPRGPVLRASWEDVVLAVMAPRAGKTTALAIPSVLDAPGAVVATSNKSDLWAATAALRAADTAQPVWVFDPQSITGTTQSWWWNPLRDLTSVEDAARLAGHFLTEIRTERTGADFWTAAAADLLTSLLLAAALSGRNLVDVYAWLNDPGVPIPATLLRAAGHSPIAAALTGRQHGATETRDGIYETARTAAACLRDPAIMAWVTPPPRANLTEFDAATLATSRQSLYLLSKDGAGAAAPLVAALTDRVMREGVRAAEKRGGRLDPPMVVVLDEAANVCKIADLPDLYSHLGSRGIVPITVLQSYRQGVRVWGQSGMDTLWSAATIKMLGAGIDDAKLAEDVSRLVGDHDVTIRSYSNGDRQQSTSTSLRRQRILPPEDLRALPRGTALLLATGARAALVRLKPSYTGPRADEIADATRRADTRNARSTTGSRLDRLTPAIDTHSEEQR